MQSEITDGASIWGFQTEKYKFRAKHICIIKADYRFIFRLFLGLWSNFEEHQAVPVDSAMEYRSLCGF